MKNIDLIEMIDEGFDDFEQERKRRKNIKLLIDFEATDITHIEKRMMMSDPPKLKQKFNSTIFIKNDKNKNSLF